MNVAEAVGRTLAALGADHVFGVVGSGNFHVTNALVAAGARFVAARHEGGAATMADAYARTSGRIGVLSVHQGCGLTNALTGITEAAKSRTPLVVLAAETGATAIRSNFRIDQDALALAVGARSERVRSAATAVDDVVRAFRLASEDRRTVVLNLPLDVQAAELPGGLPAPVLPALHPVAPSAAGVRALADELRRAERPVFIAGRGARHAAAELRELAETCGALLATSAVARGLFHDDPWSLDVSGGFATPLAAELISGADLIVGWGATLNTWTTRHGALVGPGCTVVQVDLDSDAIGAHRPVHLGVLGDVALTAEAVRAELAGQRLSGYRDASIRERIARGGSWLQIPYQDESTSDTIDPRTLTAALDRMLPTERVVAVDSGNFMGYPSTFLRVPDHHGFCFTQAFQSIGLGLATAIGAALARPDRLPVAALGDGGALMGISELETAVRLGLPLVIVVYDDHAYGAEVHHFGPDGHPLGTVRFPDTDLAAAARGFGCTGITVRGEADLEAVRDWLAGPRSAPLLIDAKVTSAEGSWWLVQAFRGH
ncbi:acetolactate synthase I/II/III large subunit [Saccharopolyspora subtropica]|uniref:Acetolactate synthase I/II/III large subunit n=1 Tax=Saccharopolyspora thermophila TaxID=89367 RepID=A0A917K093_9PSEU|nr:thiamine pyrophosphate-binding protein [Saccharopolyspora subtropica]GGI91558.1 acetolactate synthase I/II/III large subunit [Saccharopolyspora subtropica]